MGFPDKNGIIIIPTGGFIQVVKLSEVKEVIETFENNFLPFERLKVGSIHISIEKNDWEQFKKELIALKHQVLALEQKKDLSNELETWVELKLNKLRRELE